VVIGGFAVNRIETWSFASPATGDDTVREDCDESPPNVYGFGHIRYLEHVVRCIHGDEPALVDGLEGRRSLELISAIYESIETGREVELRFRPKRCRLGMGP
jgi:predicted dehydrogenase